MKNTNRLDENKQDPLNTLARDWVTWRLGPTATKDEIHRLTLAVCSWLKSDPSSVNHIRTQLYL